MDPPIEEMDGLVEHLVAAVSVGNALLVVLLYSALRAYFTRQFVGARDQELPPVVTAQDFAECGLGPVAATAAAPADGKALYLDVVKRAVLNILFYETSKPSWFYGADRVPELARAFSLRRRVLGEDMPANAFSMVGLHRLDNIQSCIERAIEDGVEGDFVETGAYRGGACIFARAVLKAHGVQDRRVVACDTFTPPKPPPGPLALALVLPAVWLLQLLSRIPYRPWRMWLFGLASKFDQDFPPMTLLTTQNESLLSDWIDLFFFFLQNVTRFHQSDMSKGLDAVKSYFARFGLLDEQVRFLQGFFADTIPEADWLRKVAVLRADGDTYESTIDALSLLYPKLSPGGFCIIDDYNSFVACKHAVDEFRKEHGIDAKLERIDNLSVYWRKPLK